MKLRINPTQFRWLTKAVSVDPHRQNICHVCAKCINGKWRLFATDTHRLHCLTPEGQGENESSDQEFHLDPKRLLFEIGTCSEFVIDSDTPKVMDFLPGRGDTEVSRIFVDGLKSPDHMKAIGTDAIDIATRFKANALYISDALSPDFESRGVHLYSSGVNRPVIMTGKEIVSTDDLWALPSFAVVMPMVIADPEQPK